MTKKLPAEQDETIGDIYARELNRLIDHYGIEPGDYRSLALRLAIDHVPNFPRFKLKHGSYGKVMRDKGVRPTDWTPEKLDELTADVERVKKECGFASDEQALKHLTAKAGKWSRPPQQNDAAKWIKRLRNELSRARSVQRSVDQLLTLVEKMRPSNPEN